MVVVNPPLPEMFKVSAAPIIIGVPEAADAVYAYCPKDAWKLPDVIFVKYPVVGSIIIT